MPDEGIVPIAHPNESLKSSMDIFKSNNYILNDGSMPLTINDKTVRNTN